MRRCARPIECCLSCSKAAPQIGEWLALFIYALLAIGLELIVWFVPSLIGGGVAVSLVGLLLGPFYPIAMNQAARILPAWLLTPSIGWIAGFGQAGSAVLPFITGALAQSTGIGSLQPLWVASLTLGSEGNIVRKRG